MNIKTRFAPSSTGYLHIGNIRTALYSWLFARKNDGKFILRIEDTDTERFIPNTINDTINVMNWLKLNWDYGPYFQSKRFIRYRNIINQMLEKGLVYKCYCSKERIDSIRQKQIKNGEKPRYDRYCRYNYQSNKNKKYVIRFANPKTGSVIFNDYIRGQIKFDNIELDDLIILRTNGYPTYNFCVVIDDMDMSITHIIRGEEHINNTPRQINILKALNAPIPIYVHLPIIRDNSGKKLSKSNGAISVMQYLKEGYLSEALLNYIVRLGWSNGNQEIFSREEMIKLFSLEHLNKSPCIFNKDKLLWFNHYYINKLPNKYVATQLKYQIKLSDIDINNGPSLSKLVKLLGTRSFTLKEIVENCYYFYCDELTHFNINAVNQHLISAASEPLKLFYNKMLKIIDWTSKNINYAIKLTANKLKLNVKDIGMPLRVAITGNIKSPPLSIIIYIIGKERSAKRIIRALDIINKIKKLNN